ncbi:hypothetical protein AAFX24_28540 [Vibrio mediterranei]|uniref:hypothetical protein n=1 Tax=Vibrio mediterranei TaxID=689 RepID=UPI0038CEF5C5
MENFAFSFQDILHLVIETPYLSHFKTIKLSYQDCVSIVATDEGFSTSSKSLDGIYNLFEKDQDKDDFKAEVIYITSRFLLREYRPTAAEIYYTLRSVGIQSSVLWNTLSPSWRVWSKLFKNEDVARRFESLTVVTVVQQLKHSIIYSSLYDEFSKHFYEVEMHGDKNKGTKLIDTEKLSYSYRISETRISNLKVTEDALSGLNMPMSDEEAKLIEAGISCTIDGEHECFLSAIDLMQLAIGLVLPEPLEKIEVDNPNELIQLLRSIAYFYFIKESFSKGTISKILFAFKVLNEHFKTIDYRAIAYYKNTEIEKDELQKAPSALLMLPHLVLDGFGTPKAFFTYM